jgi:hypothetical protein
MKHVKDEPDKNGWIREDNQELVGHYAVVTGVAVALFLSVFASTIALVNFFA